MDDLQQVILDEIRLTRSDLKAHVKDEDEKFSEIRKDVSSLQKDVALHTQRTKYVNAGIAALVSAFMAWLVSWFGVKG